MPPLFATQLADLELPLAMKIFLIAWFFFVGGCFGSFMNVVIYRLPRGRNIASPPSACPKCGKFIRWHDNLPVLSWLILRGKCRDCSEPISARYPIVEFLVGLIFMALAVQVFLPGGPWWLTNLSRAQFYAQPLPKLGAAYAYYMLLVCTLICASYIAWDGQRVPKRLFAVALLAGCMLPLYWNEVRPWEISSFDDWKETAWNGLRMGLAGAFCGAVAGGGWFDCIARRLSLPGSLLWPLAAVGWMLGPGSVLIISAAGTTIGVLWLLIMRRSPAGVRSAPIAGVTIATTIMVLCGGLWMKQAYDYFPTGVIVTGAITMMNGFFFLWFAPAALPSTEPHHD